MRLAVTVALFAITGLAGCAGTMSERSAELAAKPRAVNGGVMDQYVREQRARNLLGYASQPLPR